MYWFGQALLDIPSGVKLYRGFDVQSIYLLNPETVTLSATTSPDNDLQSWNNELERLLQQ